MKSLKRSVLLCLLLVTGASQVAAETISQSLSFGSYVRAQQIVSDMVEAYGGVDAITALNTVAFATDSTYFAFHQSFGTSDKWDAQNQWRRYAIDIGGARALFGRSMDEWSLHEFVTDELTYRLDHERRTYSSSPGGSSSVIQTVEHAVPALIVRQLYMHPYNVRFVSQTKSKQNEVAVIDYSYSNGRRAALEVDVQTALLLKLEKIGKVPPFGDTSLVTRFSNYKTIDRIPMPMTVESLVNNNTEFVHNLVDVEVNQSIDDYLTIPEGYSEVLSAKSYDWTVENIEGAVHQVSNGVYNIPLFEFDDFLVTYNASRSYDDIRSAVSAISQEYPDKPIRYAIISHHHFDRAGAVGAYVENGTAIVTSKIYEDRLRSFVVNRKTYASNSSRTTVQEPNFVFFEETDYFEGQSLKIEIKNVSENPEALVLLSVYVPDLKMLIHDGDLFRKYSNGPLRSRRPGSVALEKFIDSNEYEVDILVGNRGVPASVAELRETNQISKRD